ncbi:MAG TPA: bifunctional DNA-binding transcriptional regulator/O6-methylguanine-DNA methyltransferase Ada [Gemmatimonadales bacterium]|nr:bifunctional DNA-binding transcriptional regulator/O6-methylguanine-DNA methyltransferase Ada [Gemmatimonadales bacterium]
MTPNRSAVDVERAADTRRDPRWTSVVARSAEADGAFFYAVTTTRVYCRPSCPARRPRPEHVRFHPTRADAERAGFRPCKRCRPDRASIVERHVTRVTAVCRLIDGSDGVPPLEELAAHAGMSPFHFHRVFKAVTGVTPRRYAMAQRSARMRRELEASDTVTRAIYRSGYSSNARFYADSTSLLGMTPTDYRAGGANAEIRFAIGECSLGSILVARSRRGVCAIFLGDDPEALGRDLEERFPQATLITGDPAFERLVATVVAFVESPSRGLDLPLDVRGTAFQLRVWEALSRIPAGATATYSEIAAGIGAPRAVRAVSRACGANLLAVAIPCHRVARIGGGLAGYRWGIERKRALLEREAPAPGPTVAAPTRCGR